MFQPGQSHEPISSTKSEEFCLVVVAGAAIRLLALMPPFVSRVMRSSSGHVFESGKLRRVPRAGAHLVVVEGNIHAPVQAVLDRPMARMAEAIRSAWGLNCRCTNAVPVWIFR